MKKIALQTPEDCFTELEDYPFDSHYISVQHSDYEPLRLHYVDEGNPDGLPVLLLHGCPTWSYLYRKVINTLLVSEHASQLRIIAPDHIGCGKSDKLLHRNDYNYDFYVSTIKCFIETLNLKNITLVCQDWGGPIGLRVFSEVPERFNRIVATNTLLPNCEPPPNGILDWPGAVIKNWVDFTQQANDIPIGKIIQGVTTSKLSDKIMAAYDAPFPASCYKQGILNWPSLIPLSENASGIQENRAAWKMLETSEIPFLTAFSDSDPSTAAWENVFQHRAPGAKKICHHKILNAGHMVQEDQGILLANIIENFVFN